MPTPAVPFLPQSPLALLVTELDASQREDLILVLARIDDSLRRQKNAGDYWLKMAYLSEEKASQWPQRLWEGYAKPTKTERASGAAFAPRARADALDIAMARLLLVASDKIDEEDEPTRQNRRLLGTEGETFDYAEYVDRREQWAVLRQAVAMLDDILPGEDRNARIRAGIRLRMEGLEREEIAARFGVPLQTVDNDCSIALRAIRKWKGEQERAQLAERARDEARRRRHGTYGSGALHEIPARLLDRNGTATDLHLTIDGLQWSEDGQLTAAVILPTPWPASCFGFAVARVATDQASMASSAFQLVAENGRAMLRAFLGKPPANTALRGPLPLPAQDVRLVLAHADELTDSPK